MFPLRRQKSFLKLCSSGTSSRSIRARGGPMDSPDVADRGRGLSRRTFLGATGAALLGSGVAGAGLSFPSAVGAAAADYNPPPSLEFGDAALQAALGTPYQSALENLIEINTVF